MTTDPLQGQQSGAARLIFVALPLMLFMALIVVFLFRLRNDDPSRLPSALIAHPAPATTLPPLDGLSASGVAVPGLAPSAFQGRVSIVNVWASWCVPCRVEAPMLDALHGDHRFAILGINYKDVPDDARRFLARYGNAFDAVGVDASGRTGIEWGVYGVPETFVVGRDGRITFKLVGPITPDNINTMLMPEIEKALHASPRG